MVSGACAPVFIPAESSGLLEQVLCYFCPSSQTLYRSFHKDIHAQLYMRTELEDNARAAS